MAKTEELEPKLRTFVNMYAWRRNDPIPWTVALKPIGDSRVGLVVTPCQTLPDQPAFQATEPDFDVSMRVIPSDTDPRVMVNTYPGQAFDHAGLREDPDLLIPLDRMRELAAAGEIAGFAPRTVSLCGHIPHPDALVSDTAPKIARLFVDDGADAVMLVPA